MDEQKQSPLTVDEYIAQFPPQTQELLQLMRLTIKEAAPEATECIRYQMPAYQLNGPLVYFAANRNHMGFYPTAEGIAAFEGEFQAYKTSKGAIQFPYSMPLPLELIKKIVQHRLAENTSKHTRKTK